VQHLIVTQGVDGATRSGAPVRALRVQVIDALHHADSNGSGCSKKRRTRSGSRASSAARRTARVREALRRGTGGIAIW